MKIKKKSLINDKHLTGVLSELTAIKLLMKSDFLVCKNVCGHGLVDLIAVSSDGEVFLIDVKTQSRRENVPKGKDKIFRVPTSEQKKMGVVLMVIDNNRVSVSPSHSRLSKLIKNNLKCQ